MKNKDLVLETMRRSGRLIAQDVQTKSAEMNGTELNAEADYIPDFKSACAVMNMLARKAGMTDGFIC